MQLTCPYCGEPVLSENINIQQMTAVCPSCSAVFQFDPPGGKIKHRKVKQPEQLLLHESDHGMSLAFRTNFRLRQNEAFLSTGFVALGFTFFTVFMVVSNASLFITLSLGVVTLFLYYLISLIVYNKTHIDVHDETIQVSRNPIPVIWDQPSDINLSGVQRIRYAETPISIREGYDLPRYNVWAEMVDGSRKMIVTDVIDDYAAFIVQELNEYLNMGAPTNSLGLIDDGEMSDGEQAFDESLPYTDANR